MNFSMHKRPFDAFREPACKKKALTSEGCNVKRAAVIPLLYRVWLVVHPSDPGAYRALQSWYSAGDRAEWTLCHEKNVENIKTPLEKKTSTIILSDSSVLLCSSIWIIPAELHFLSRKITVWGEYLQTIFLFRSGVSWIIEKWFYAFEEGIIRIIVFESPIDVIATQICQLNPNACGAADKHRHLNDMFQC